MRPLPLRTSLTLVNTGIVALLLAAMGLSYHSVLVRRLERDATQTLEEKALGLHGYLRFRNGAPVLDYRPDDAAAKAFIDDVTDYYQIYDARDGRLLAQSPGLESLGVRATPAEVAALRDHPGVHDVQTDRGRLRLVTTLLEPGPGESYVVQVGDMLDGVDRSVAAFNRLLVWWLVGGLALAAAVGRWLAGRALAPLSKLAHAAGAIDVTKLDARLPLRGAGDELDSVVHSFNEALARVEAAVEEMRQFSAALAHELRTPLAILRGEAELALRPSAPGDAPRLALTRQIDECDRLTRLINQILTLARADAGEIEMAREPVDLAALAASMVDQIEPVAAARGIALTCEPSAADPVAGDAGWLGRLLLIVLDNAIKFTPSGGRITVRFPHEPGAALVAIADTGRGIPEGALPHLFERFYRADPSRSAETEGAGLGLSLAKWIVDQHHGTIRVTSRIGAGTTVTVGLPAMGAS